MCSSDLLGPIALEGDGAEVFLGRDWIRSDPHYSQQTGTRIDEDVRTLAQQSLKMALAVLQPRRELMDHLVERLIREETIDGESFRQDVEAWQAAHPEVPLPPSPRYFAPSPPQASPSVLTR